MKIVRRIIAVFGLILVIFSISYLVYTAKEVDFDKISLETEITEAYSESVMIEEETLIGG